MLTEIEVSGQHTPVFRAGDGPPLVWFHGLYGVDFDAPIITRLAEHHTVYAPLAPGFTDLADLDELRDIHDLAFLYDDLFTALQLERVPMAGHSFGAMIAAELVAHIPARASQLVLLSPLGLWNDAHPVADLFGVPQSDVPKLLYSDPAHLVPPRTETDIETTLSLVRGMTTVARFLWPIPDRGLSRRLRRIACPTLIAYGADDHFVPAAYADDFAALLPNASTRIIPSAGHMLTVEARDSVVELISEFVSSAPSLTGRSTR
jgi:pimeloyl-ACP methyl ester carboxylesterase